MDKQFFIILSAILFLLYTAIVQAQTVEGNRDIERVKQIKEQAETHFNQGLTALKNNQRPQARENFDKSVEVFVKSDLQNHQIFRECFNQLTETINRIEFPNNQKMPNIPNLSATCNWKIEEQISENMIKIAQNSGNDEPDAKQKSEPSPLDELSKLELTEGEQQVETNPVAQQEYQQMKVAVTNKSLGFNFQMHPMVQQYINYYRGRGRQTMETGLHRSGIFMQMVRKIFREEGIPENIAWLGQVESAWKPTARSWAAAAGLWQFIPGTGARYGLRQNVYIDERNSFEKATRASAQYLKFLANRYGGNWELGMAAYNCGEGNVDRAIRRAGVASFWAAYPYLPQETRNYVPNILATILIANNPNYYGFSHVRPAAQLQYETIRVPPTTNLYLIAQASNTTIEYIRYLNPEFRSNITPPEPYIIRIPAGKSTAVMPLFQKRLSTTKTL